MIAAAETPKYSQVTIRQIIIKKKLYNLIGIVVFKGNKVICFQIEYNVK